MGDIFNVLLLQTTLRSATPVVLAAMGCLMTQHVNITNIGIDGMMLIGAFFAVVGSYYMGSWVGGIALALLLDGVGNIQHHIGIADGTAHEVHHRLLQLVCGLQNTRRVGIDDLEIVAIDDTHNAVARGLRLRGYD